MLKRERNQDEDTLIAISFGNQGYLICEASKLEQKQLGDILLLRIEGVSGGAYARLAEQNVLHMNQMYPKTREEFSKGRLFRWIPHLADPPLLISALVSSFL